jgi:hypothetical protein
MAAVWGCFALFVASTNVPCLRFSLPLDRGAWHFAQSMFHYVKVWYVVASGYCPGYSLATWPIKNCLHLRHPLFASNSKCSLLVSFRKHIVMHQVVLRHSDRTCGQLDQSCVQTTPILWGDSGLCLPTIYTKRSSCVNESKANNRNDSINESEIKVINSCGNVYI